MLSSTTSDFSEEPFSRHFLTVSVFNAGKQVKPQSGTDAGNDQIRS
jgi:hypothetical protein